MYHRFTMRYPSASHHKMGGQTRRPFLNWAGRQGFRHHPGLNEVYQVRSRF